MMQHFKAYDSYVDFVNDFMFTVMDEGYAVIVVNYKDYYGLLASLQEKTINGNSLYLDVDTIDGYDNDIETAQSRDGLIMVTVFEDARIVGEAVVYDTADAYIEGSYFVEKDAQSFLTKPVRGRVTPFEIKKERL